MGRASSTKECVTPGRNAPISLLLLHEFECVGIFSANYCFVMRHPISLNLLISLPLYDERWNIQWYTVS